MIFYVSTGRFSSTVRHFLDRYPKETRGVLASLTYEELFFERAGPIGHYIFTDFDRLSRYEIECAATFANALGRVAPGARILNHPLKVLERFPLLIALHKAGINDFTATRLESGDRPPRYPVFIRAEDGFGGPETDILNNDEEYDAAVEDLAQRGLPMRGRIAIGYANKPTPEGRFEKYGAFNIGGTIVPNDLTYGRTWVVKIRYTGWGEGRDEDYGLSEQGAAKELQYVAENPHADVLARAFAVGGIDFGRADYGIVDGRVQIYEINTNPHLPVSRSSNLRARRHATVQKGLLDGFKAIDTPVDVRGRVGFTERRPRVHDLRWPRRQFVSSFARRARDLVAAPKRS